VINRKPDLVRALRDNPELISLLGGPYIHQLKRDPNQYPSISYFQYNHVDSDYAEDRETASWIFFQIDIWTKNASDLSPIAQQVDKSLKALGFFRLSVIDMYEDDVHVFHTAMRYRGKFLIEEE
jgi:hypothetical protein